MLSRIEAAGGTLAAIESGMIQREIQESAFRAQRAIDSGESPVVGVTKFQTDEGADDSDLPRRSGDRARAAGARRRGARRA